MQALIETLARPQIPSAKALQESLQNTPELFAVLAAAREETISSSELAAMQTRWGWLKAHLRVGVSSLIQVALCALKNVAKCFGAKNWKRQIRVCNNRLYSASAHLRLFETYGTNFLMPMVNTHRRGTEDLYCLPKCPELNPPHSPFITFKFHHPKGICRGISDLFLFLYLRAKEQFPSKENLLKAVARVFEHGAPREAAVLQQMLEEPVDQALSIDSKTVAIVKDPKGNLATLCQTLFNLQEGEYGISAFFAGHRFNWIRVGMTRYLIDPTYGCFRIEEVKTLEKFFTDHLPRPYVPEMVERDVWIRQVQLR